MHVTRQYVCSVGPGDEPGDRVDEPAAGGGVLCPNLGEGMGCGELFGNQHATPGRVGHAGGDHPHRAHSNAGQLLAEKILSQRRWSQQPPLDSSETTLVIEYLGEVALAAMFHVKHLPKWVLLDDLSVGMVGKRKPVRGGAAREHMVVIAGCLPADSVRRGDAGPGRRRLVG